MANVANNGGGWIRQDKRLAIYMRDGMACVYCLRGLDEEIRFTLDHLIPQSKGGDNHEINLVTCCKICNSRRGNTDVDVWIKAIAAELGADPQQMWDYVWDHAATPITELRKQAKQIIARRRTFAGAIEEAV